MRILHYRCWVILNRILQIHSVGPEFFVSFTQPRSPLGGANAYMFYIFFCFFFAFLFFFPFATTIVQNMRQPFSGTAGRIFMKLLPNDTGENGISNNFVGAKNWKIAKNRPRCIQFWAYNSERKRISERLKRLWNHKTMAYKEYAWPWPLTPR